MDNSPWTMAIKANINVRDTTMGYGLSPMVQRLQPPQKTLTFIRTNINLIPLYLQRHNDL